MLMLLRFLRSSQPAMIILLPVLALLLAVPIFVGSWPIQATGATQPLYQLLVFLTGGFPVVLQIIGVVLLGAQALLLNYIVEDSRILQKKTYLPGLLFLLIGNAFFTGWGMHPVFCASLFLLFFFYQLVELSRTEKAKSKAFNAGLLISIASMFYFPAIVFFVVLLVALVSFRSFSWREWSVALLGLLLPYVYLLAYYHWVDTTQLFGDYLTPFAYELSDQPLGWSFYFLMTLLLLSGFWSLRMFLKLIGVNKVRMRKLLVLQVWFALLALSSMSLSPQIQLVAAGLVTIPLSIYLANYFLMSKQFWLAELLLIGLIAATICYRYLPIFYT